MHRFAAHPGCTPNAKRGRCCHRPRLRFRPGSLDPGRFPIGFWRSKLLQGPIRDGPKQASRHPFRRSRSKLRFCLSDVFPASRRPSSNILPASRRLSVAALFHRANPISRPSVSLRANPSSPFRSPLEQALRAAFRNSLARRLRSCRTPEKWVRLWVSPLPRASSRLPHQSVPGFLPEGSRPSRHWRRLEFLPRCRLVTPDRERSE